MVQELRQIVLDKNELISALESHRGMTCGYMPTGKIIDLAIVDDTNSVNVTLASVSQGKEISVMLSDAMLLQPLIRFCIENNIMLPRQGSKKVCVTKEHVALRIILDGYVFVPSEKDIMRLHPDATAH